MNHQQQPVAEHFLGIDVSKASLAIALAADDGEAQALPDVANDDGGWNHLRGTLIESGFSGTICMEPTSVYHLGAAKYLSDAGFEVALVSCKGAKDYSASVGLRNKTDAADAASIALYARSLRQCGKLRTWRERSKAQQRLTSLAKLFFIAQSIELGHKNRLESADKEEAKTIRRWLRASEKETGKLRAQMTQLCREEEEFAARFAHLCTIPGVGEHLAAMSLALEVHKCESSKAAAAMHAFAPSQRQSGSSVRGSCLSFTGHRRMRHLTYMPALAAMRCNPPVSALAERMRARGAPGKVIVCACAHKLLRIIWGVANGDKPFDANHAANRD